jgi:hypothetical protein
MEPKGHKLPPYLASALRFAAAQYARRERARAWLYFGLTTFALLALGTGVLTVIGGRESNFRMAVLSVCLILELMSAAYWFLYRARRAVSIKQLALYIDQLHPELQNRIVSAVEFAKVEGASPKDTARDAAGSPWLIEKFLEETDFVTKSTPIGDLIDERKLTWLARSAAFSLAACALTLLLFNSLWLPDMRFAMRAVGLGALTQVKFTVTPGNAEIRRGESAIIVVEAKKPLPDAVLVWQSEAGPENIVPMTAASDGRVWHYDFRNVQSDFQYRVQLAGTQSETYAITTWVPPQTEAVHLHYTFPEYLRKPDEEARNSGPITAIAGTRVAIEVEVNKTMKEATLVLDSGVRVPLAESPDGHWKGGLNVEANGKYHIEVADLQGRTNEYQPFYDIVALKDAAPKVRVASPRGDDEATAIEEIPFVFEISDDFGIESYGIQYEVAGREPVRIVLPSEQQPEGEPLLKKNGEHGLALEELRLETGDIVTWTVWARDFKPDRDTFEELGDPYFLEVRPFRRTFVEAISNAGGGGGGGGGNPDAGSMDQKEIIIATWNLRRSHADMPEQDFLAKRNTIIEAQEKLIAERLEAQNLMATDLLAPGIGPTGTAGDSKEETLQKQLDEAQQGVVDALQNATMPEPKPQLTKAMEQGQRAYSFLKKMEDDQRSVQMARNGQNQQGQGGRGAGQREIDGLELDRNQNFYEEEQSTQSPAEQKATEAAVAGLKELAQRQQLANEEMSKLISELEQAKTEEEKEEIRRRLKRLEEEMKKNLERLDQVSSEVASGQTDPQQSADTQQNLDRARNDMDQSLENVRKDKLQEARASGTRAADALEKMQQDLSGTSRTAAAGRLRDLTNEMDELEKRQREILAELDQLKKDDAAKSLDNLDAQDKKQKDLITEKDALAKNFEDLMEGVNQLAQGTQQSEELLSRKLNDWLRDTSQRAVPDQMRKSAPLVNYGIWDPLIEAEEKIANDMHAAGEALRGIDEFRVEDDVDALRMALREIRDVLDSPPPQNQAQGAQPGENQQQSDQPSAPGGQPGQETQPGGEPQQPEPASEESQAPSDGEQQQPGQPSEGQQEGQQAQGGGQQPGEQQRGGNPAQGERGGQAIPRDGGGGGGYNPENIEQFVATDYGRWLDGIRNAETLLPDERMAPGEEGVETARQRLERVRETIGGMRREYRTRGVPPKFEGFLDQVVKPLTEAAAEIDREIRERLEDDEFALTRQAEVPDQFKGSVAEYFRLLSEAAASGN